MWPRNNGPKPGRDAPKQIYNFILGLFVGTFGCRFGLNLLKADRRFKSKIFTVACFMEKNSKNMRDYQRKVERLGVKKWDSFKQLFFELIGNGEEFGKDPQVCLDEFQIWNKRTEEAVHKIVNHDSDFGKSSVVLATITVGGHFFVLLDMVRLLIERHRSIKYRIGVLIVPEDELSTKIYQGVMWFLRRYKIFDAVIVWNNNNMNPLRPVEVQDLLASLGLVTLLHRDAQSQPDISNFDFVSSICKHEDGKTHFYGLSAEVTNIPREPYQVFGIITKKEKNLARTILEITNLVNAVLKFDKTNMTGFPWKDDSPVHIAVIGNLDWLTEVRPGIQDWKANKTINIKFLPAVLKDDSKEKFPKMVAVALREIEPPVFTDNKVKEFKKCLKDYWDNIGTTEKKFREDYGCPEVEEKPEREKPTHAKSNGNEKGPKVEEKLETEKPDDVVTMNNEEKEDKDKEDGS